MKTKGPIILIEDDNEDQEIFKIAFDRLGYSNKLLIFSNGDQALEFLKDPAVIPFIIISDINMPGMNGFELRNKIREDQNLDIKCTPYLFFSTSSSPTTIIEAYSHSVQGFFKKENTVQEIQSTLGLIMQYWNKCMPPFYK